MSIPSHPIIENPEEDRTGENGIAEPTRQERLIPSCWNQLRRALYTPFRPGYRHEVISALAAWQVWQQETASVLTGLAVYLIATHHGKVRTVLRATAKRDAVFGIEEGEKFPGWGELVLEPLALPTGARRFGAEGEWSNGGTIFTPRWSRCTSWAALVADLLGGLPETSTKTTMEESLSDDQKKELRNLGPFRLAYLETILRVADARASACPGRGKDR